MNSEMDMEMKDLDEMQDSADIPGGWGNESGLTGTNESPAKSTPPQTKGVIASRHSKFQLVNKPPTKETNARKSFRHSLSGSTSSSSSSLTKFLEEEQNVSLTGKKHVHHHHRVQSVHTFIKERILYHGPKPYLEDYKQGRARYETPIPKPPKITRKNEELVVETVKTEALGSDDSHVSEEKVVVPFSEYKVHSDDLETSSSQIKQAEMEKIEEIMKIRKSEKTIRKKTGDAPSIKSDMSIAERICLLQDEAKIHPTLRDRYVGFKQVKGFPNCVDRTEGHPECLPPGELVRNAIKPNELWGIPEYYPLKKNLLLELMRKMEKYPNSDYLCLQVVGSPSDPKFNPYLLQIVKYKDVNPRNYYTLSKYGLLHFTAGFSEHISMLEFEKQIHMFDRVRQIPFFVQYKLWKAFYLWHYNIVHYKFNTHRKQLEEALFITKRPLRKMIMEMFKLSQKVADMGFLALKHGTTLSLADFMGMNDNRTHEIRARLESYQKMVTEMTLAACRSAMLEAGFTPDNYPQELEYYMKGLEVPVDSYMSPMDLLSYPGQWLSYSKQMQKRRLCARLTNFIHLIDFYAQATCHKLLKNSIFAVMCELEARLRDAKGDFVNPSKYLPRFHAMKEKHENLHGTIPLSESDDPIFEVGCSWDKDGLLFSPPIEDYLKGMRVLLGNWESEVMLYDNMLPRDAFNPYTQVIVNGFMDPKTCGDGPSMDHLLRADSDFVELKEIIDLIMLHGFEVCRGYIDRFENVRKFCQENDATDIEKFRELQDVQEFERLLEKYHTQLDTIRDLEDEKNLGPFCVNNRVLRDNAYPSIHRCLEALNETLPRFGGMMVRELQERMKEAIMTLEKMPTTADEYVDFLLYLDDIQEKMDDIEQALDICSEIFDLLFYYEIPADEADIGGYSTLNGQLSQLHSLLDRQLMNRDNLITELVEQFQVATEQMHEDMEEIQRIAMAPEVLDPNTDPQQMCDKLTQCRDTLAAHQERAAKFNIYQKQLKLEVTNFEDLDKLLVEVKLRHQFWDSITSWEKQRQEWDEAPFHTLDQDEMTREVNRFVKSIQQLEKGLPPNEVVPILKAKVEDMRAQLPLIGQLHNPNLQRRHWDTLEKAMNRTLTDDSVTLKNLNEETGVQNFAELIAEVSAQASSESSLEALLKKVEDSWKDVEFIVLPYKDHRDNYILGGTDDIQVLLDDSNIHMATIASSRHVGPIKHKVEEWTRLLDLFSRTLDEWLNCQRNYIYLESIFSAPDIQRQLPNESKMFAQVDKNWRDIMQRTNKMPAALRAATAQGVLEKILVSNELLDQILKCLDDYLESKRVIFPRFYFLSNEELLEILAQTRNPQAVQPHLRKCFDAIQRLEFGGPSNATTLDVLAMFSPEEERVALTKGLKARGNVEDWLGKVEEAMFHSLQRIMRNALADYHVYDREEWLQKFPSQCVLTISQLMWAQMVHEVLDAPGNKLEKMVGFEKKNFESLNKLAVMVRGQLHPLVRSVLCALITIDVHARDIVSSMVQKKVDSSTDFEWLKQLRYYWEKEAEVVLARMANAQYFYGYEYLGASPRLVITPLTDRCYLCLMGALQLDLGGAPAGPAGTGKTETTKDLAKSLAFMCVVFNCSEGLDYKMMGRFFAGLAQSGGWCCFDEFNRIDIEVLSVIAQQLITIRLAKVHKLTRFLFEGREIKLVKTCAAFITMNPGYAGRTELPDNLKALFRPISMMVPDYTLIAEVILYSEGFESSKTLANKMTQMYKLCSEQLSQQDHYDFGMRAVKSVLVMAGSLKRSNPDINENIVLIRALRDSNLPKFLAHDAILLHGIIQDLFPGVVIPEQDFGHLQKEAIKCAKEKGYQVPDCFIRKVIQLYETLVVRHGVMLVGPTGGGKTTIYEVLKTALASLHANKIEGPMYRPVETYLLNPKAVSLGELYGEVNPLTFEWRDGLLGIMVRNAVKPKATYPQWVICDGPVDAIWIENMNTVLDDNKMLCLANSERIKLTNWVRMMFEVQDLAQASPATVSRCGMVYVDPKEMGWKPFVQSWLARLNSPNQELKPFLRDLFNKYMDNAFAFIQKRCHEIMPQSQIGKTDMMCSVLLAMLTKRKLDYESERPKFLQNVCHIFIFAYLWSIGGTIDEEFHEIFSDFAKNEFSKEEFCKLPKSGHLWQYYCNLESRRFEMWETIMPAFVYNNAISFVDILVPTVDTVRFGFLMELLLGVNRGVLFTGSTGTGKSAIAKYVLSTISSKYDYLPVYINFSAQTTSQRTQEMIEGKLERRKKALMAAPIGKKVIVFIDDLNMPKLDRYGAQPALELLRQLMDFNGCYDRHKLFWKELQNVILMSACGPPGGGRNAVTPRLLRHFCMLSIPVPNHNVLRQIYRAIMRGFLTEFDQEIQGMADSIVNAAIDTYQFMVQTFLPTPSKSHYVFNMRDLSKCIQGVLQANRYVTVKKENLVRLYYHECQRVFHDRLADETDKMIFCNSLAELCTRAFGIPTSASKMKGIIYGDFMKMGVDKENRIYDEITSRSKLTSVLSDYLDEYNITTPKEMQIVFFADATEHIARIARILRTDRGNALLVGVGGTGKQSLTKLAAHISGYKCFRIELMRGYDYAAFHDDLKKLYQIAGLDNEPVVFLFTDTQIAYEEFLEDINNILNSGEVPNLLQPEDQERLMAGVRSQAKALGINEEDRDTVYDYFIRRIRSNLHIVLCMSPVGDSFRVRCRMFPSLVNCCTINWFSEWPTEALLSVARNLLSKIDLGKGISVDAMADISVLVHESVSKMSERFYEEMRRRYYTTPSSYLELINLYTTMLHQRRDKINQGKARISNGLIKLLETNKLVKDMRVQLKELEPVLVQKSNAVENLMVKLAEEQAAADVVRKNVQAEELVAKEKAVDTQLIAEDAQRDLAEVSPALEAAAKSLEALDKNDISEIRAYQKPPDSVRTVMESVCILFGSKPDWSSARALLTDVNFIKKLFDFDKDNVSESTIKKLKVYIDNPKFQPNIVEKVSKACKSICMWVRAIDLYAKVFKVVEPKRNRYLGAQAELDLVMETLKAKQSQLNEVEKQITKLQEVYQSNVDEKMRLEDNMELTAARVRRAGKLTSALASEQVRWTESVKKFDEEKRNLIGDVFVGAACVAYFGAFTSFYRQILVTEWVKRCVDLKLPINPKFTLVSFADPFEIRVWNANGLPRDNTSTENAILATRGRRWPLMIDPQDQANRWIKQMEGDKNLKVLKISDPTFMRTMENCVRLGNPALLEEVGETLDPSLEPILLRQIFTQAGRAMIRLGDTNVDYDANFRLYMTTKLSNPHYLPEVCIKVTIVNFTVTITGLEDQLLSDVVRLERPDLEKQRQALVTQINSDKNQLVSLETKILRLLFQSEGNILDDEELIQALNDSKETSSVITKRLGEAEVTEVRISGAREKYRPAASRGSVLYFVVAQLSGLDPMYQFSLKYFTQVFNNCISTAQKSDDLEERLRILKKETTLATYTNISRGLFEKDKLIFSFILCTDIMRDRGNISENEWNFFLRGGKGTESARTKKPPQATWITATQWNYICDLEGTFKFLKNFSKSCLTEVIRFRIGNFKTLLFARGGAKLKINDQWDKSLSKFQKIIIIRSIAQELLVDAITEFVHQELGQKFIESPAVDLSKIYKDLNNVTPLIFVLSVGSDPMASFYRFAGEHKYENRVSSISLGQGQGPVAELLLRNATATGDWVFLQNCHLASSWMPSLERIVKKMSENAVDIAKNFRLYLSSMPSESFPVSVLQESVKITNEPPKGIRANVKRALVDMTREFFEDHLLQLDWRRILFGICVFHAVIQERKKFGPLGWNIKYEFNDSDRQCCFLNMQMFCKGGTIPWDALEYITSLITYGGRITDNWDQRCLTTILKGYFSKKTLNRAHKYSPSGLYYAPIYKKMEEFLDYVDKLPLTDDPEIFGMHENANITFQRNESTTLLNSILAVQPRQAGGSVASAKDSMAYDLAVSIESQLPSKIDIDRANPKLFKLDQKGRSPSLGVFLHQEIDRFNKLLAVLESTLGDLKKGIKGLVVMSEDLEKMYHSFLDNQVPESWTRAGYGSKKSLGSWVKDLILRVRFINSWQLGETGPSSYWISGFFFQQGFLTAVLQGFARKYQLPIDQLKFHYQVSTVVKEQTVKPDPNVEKSIVRPRDGVLVHGLFLEAGRWDMGSKSLADPVPGDMNPMMPVIHFLPTQKPIPEKFVYTCPLYKTADRAGVLSTTGHSTNFIVAIELPSRVPQDHWILRGTALLSQLTD